MKLFKKYEAIRKILEAGRIKIYFEEYGFWTEVNQEKAIMFICDSWKYPNVYIHEYGDLIHINTLANKKVKNEVIQ